MHYARISLPVVLAGLLLGGCSTVSPVAQPDMPLPEQLGDSSGALTTAPSWWQDFSDDNLNQLVQQGLKQNFALQAAWASLESSRAVWRQAGADQFPQLDLNVKKSRQWQEDDTTTTSWSAGLSASYEVDFWGRVSALDDKARFTAMSSEAAVRTQANTVAAQIALNWYGLIKQHELLRLLEQQKQRITDALKVTEGRFQRGQAAISDVWQQQQLLESINTDLISARAQRDAYHQQLALWTGDAAGLDLNNPRAYSASDILPAVDGVDAGVGLNQLQSRPDVQQAWLAVQSANAGLAAAVANRYPRLTLTASYTGSAPQLADVMDNWVANLAAGLVMPLIDGGNRRAAVAQSEAEVKAALADYQQTLLEAALEVQQALIDEREAAATLLSLQRRLELARKTEAFQSNRYRKGVGDFLSLLNTREDLITLEQQVLNARWTQIQKRIELYRAVSHGDFLHKETSV